MSEEIIPLNIPACTGNEAQYVNDVLSHPEFFNSRVYTHKCLEWFRDYFDAEVFFTKSCTQALEFAMLLLGISPGDEVILPSYTFVSAANAIALRGATPVFTDSLPGNMNIDPESLRQAISERTKAIVIMHYAGIACEMEPIQEIAAEHNLPIIEDAAHAIMATYKGKPLGAFGSLATFSFEQMKNITCGQGGLLVIKDKELAAKAEILTENGTDKLSFLRGGIPFYQWKEIGTNGKLSELQTAYLWGQLEKANEITQERKRIWDRYHEAFAELEKAGFFHRPMVPGSASHNAHIYFLRVKDENTRKAISAWCKDHAVLATFHYMPLHHSTAGKKIGRLANSDQHVVRESGRLVRLPLFYGLSESQQNHVIETIYSFYNQGLSSH